MELTHDEKLAAAKVLQRKVDELVKDLEAGVKHDLLIQFDENGNDRKTVFVAGSKVGSYIVVAPKMTPQIVPGYEEEALEFLSANGLTTIQPIKGWEKNFINIGGRALLEHTGEMCDFIEFAPSKAPYIRAVDFKEETVREAFQAKGLGTGDLPNLLEAAGV